MTKHDMMARADELAAYLRLVDGLGGVPVIVARQRNLKPEIDAAVAKATGAAILIALDGWRQVDREGWESTVVLEHSVSVWTQPILRAGAVPESAVLGALVAAIHGWVPDPQDCQRWSTAAGRYISHPTHRIYEFPAEIRFYLPPVKMTEAEEEE